MIITRDELNKIKELNKLTASSTLLKIIQSAEEFGAIDGRKERQEANTIALRKVLTDCGLEVEGMGFGDMLYELRKIIKNREGETSKEPKVLGVDGVEIKPGDELYRRDEIPSLDGIFAGVVESVHADNCPNPLEGNKPWVRYKTGGWDLVEGLTHQKPETLQDVIADIEGSCTDYWGCVDYNCEECPAKIYGKTPCDYYKVAGCDVAKIHDIKRRLEAIAKRMGGNA